MHLVPEPGHLGKGDAEPARRPTHSLTPGSFHRRSEIRRPRVGARARIEDARAVAHRAGDHMIHHRAAPGFPDIGTDRRPSPGRFQAEEATAGGGNPDRSPTVTAGGDRDHAGRDRGRRASARSARGSAGIPGVPGRTEGGGLGERSQTELRGVGFAEEEEAGAAVSGDQLAVGGRTKVPEKGAPAPEGLPFHGEHEVLDEERNPSEPTLERSAGCFPGGPVHAMDHRIHRRIQPLDPADRRVGQLDGGHFAPPHQVGQRGGVVTEVVGIGEHRMVPGTWVPAAGCW